MAGSGRHTGFFLVALMFISGGHLFSQELWSEVSIDKSSVYVGEPVQVKISVFTSTWFTRGADLGNIKVNGAFTVYFRPVSSSVVKDGKTYAGVELIYNVFPYSEKDIVFPSLDIAVETPPEGDYKGVRQLVKSPEKPIRVKPVPSGFSQDEWLVTTRVSLSDNWQGDLQHVKVGDVLVRRISIEAQATVSELIPPVRWDSIPGASLYRARSTVENNKTRTSFSATRRETMRFLFEKEGEVTIPEMVFSWYDPVQRQLFKRTLKEIKIEVQPNPDLGILASIRDSLRVAQAEAMQETKEDEPIRIWGLTPGRFAVVVILAVLFVYFSMLFTRRLLRFLKIGREHYRNSEAFYFHEFKKAAGRKDIKSIAQALYRWIDELKLPEPSVAYFAMNYGSKELQEEARMIAADVNIPQSGLKLQLKEWHKARKKCLEAKMKPSRDRLTGWINPVEYN